MSTLPGGVLCPAHNVGLKRRKTSGDGTATIESLSQQTVAASSETAYRQHAACKLPHHGALRWDTASQTPCTDAACRGAPTVNPCLPNSQAPYLILRQPYPPKRKRTRTMITSVSCVHACQRLRCIPKPENPRRPERRRCQRPTLFR